jgi:hypothetical protein
VLVEVLVERRAEPGQHHLQVRHRERGALKEGAAVRVVGVLIERDDVRAVVAEQRSEGGDDALPGHLKREVPEERVHGDGARGRWSRCSGSVTRRACHSITLTDLTCE